MQHPTPSALQIGLIGDLYVIGSTHCIAAHGTLTARITISPRDGQSRERIPKVSTPAFLDGSSNVKRLARGPGEDR